MIPNGLLLALPERGPGRGPGRGAGFAGRTGAGVPGAGRPAARCFAATCAASCSFLSCAARASAAATSMSWALAGFDSTTGALEAGAAFRGGPGTPGFGAALGTAVGFVPVDVSTGAAAGGAAVIAVGCGPATAMASRKRRATGASTVLDADLTNSPMSFNLASTVLLSTPSSLASSCTRALPGTALLTLRSCERHPQRPHSCTRSLVISGTSSCAHVGRPTLQTGEAPTPHHRWLAAAMRPQRGALPTDRCQEHR